MPCHTTWWLWPLMGLYFVLWYYSLPTFKCWIIAFSVDATEEDGTLGRLINHSRTFANLKSQGIEVDETPHLIFYATRDIKPEEELLYDYGDRSTASLRVHPWLKS